MSRLHPGKHSFDRRYEIHFEKKTEPVNGKKPRKKVTEEIFYAKVHGGKSIHEIIQKLTPIQEHPNDNERPIFLQFLNCFRKEDFVEPECKTVPYVIKTMLVEFLSQEYMIDLHKQIVTYCADYKDLRANPYMRRDEIDTPRDYACKILNSVNLHERLSQWIDDGMDSLLNKPICSDSVLSFSNVSTFCVLFLYSECFSYGVEQYLLDSVNAAVAPSEYFDSIDFSQNDYSNKVSYSDRNSFRISVEREYHRIRKLILFAEKYMNKDSYKDRTLLVKTEAFLNAYLGLDIRKRRKYAIEDSIRRTISQLLAERPKNIDLDTRILWSKIENLYQKIKYNNVLAVGYSLYAICVENEDILQPSLSLKQRQALIELKKIYASSALWPNSNSEESEISAEQIFCELELFYGESGFADAYVCNSYFEACCISMYCILRYGLETAVCSSCGRVYIPKRMRAGEKISEICCWYEDPLHSKYTCGSYDSKFSGKYSGSDTYQEIYKRIADIRKKITDWNPTQDLGTKENRIINIDGSIEGVLDTIRDKAKNLDKKQLLYSEIQEINEILTHIENMFSFLINPENYKSCARDEEKMQLNIYRQIIEQLGSGCKYEELKLLIPYKQQNSD